MLEAFIREVQRNRWPVYGVEMMQHGGVLARHDFVSPARRPIYSATKAFTATAVGFAVEDGSISLQDNLLTCFGDRLPAGLTGGQAEALRLITLRRLLTMSVSGYPFRPEGEDWLTFSLSCALEDVRTPRFHYSNIPAYLAGVMVERAVGRNLADFLEERLFGPLGIEKPVCSFCPSGHFYGASGMELTVQELGKLGLLYLQGGCWNGKQLLSAGWTAEAAGAQIPYREGGYGYFIWRCAGNGFRISGKWGQRCFVFPEKNAVVTYLADLRQDGVSDQVSDCMMRTIWAAL